MGRLIPGVGSQVPDWRGLRTPVGSGSDFSPTGDGSAWADTLQAALDDTLAVPTFGPVTPFQWTSQDPSLGGQSGIYSNGNWTFPTQPGADYGNGGGGAQGGQGNIAGSVLQAAATRAKKSSRGASSLKQAKVVSFSAAGDYARTYGGEYTVTVIDLAGNEYETVEHVPNIKENGDVHGFLPANKPVTILTDGYGKWYIDTGMEVLR